MKTLWYELQNLSVTQHVLPSRSSHSMREKDMEIDSRKHVGVMIVVSRGTWDHKGRQPAPDRGGHRRLHGGDDRTRSFAYTKAETWSCSPSFTHGLWYSALYIVSSSSLLDEWLSWHPFQLSDSMILWPQRPIAVRRWKVLLANGVKVNTWGGL